MKALSVPPLHAIVLATAAPLLLAAAAHAQTVPLVAFYSPSRGDFFTTSDPSWTCKLSGCATDIGDYELRGMQGHVFDPERDQPPDTVPLWHWWGAGRGDNFLTSNPEWDPADGSSRVSVGARYSFVRVAGYIPLSGRSPHLNLMSFWSSSAADNAALTSGSTTMRLRVPAGYGSYRIEGQLLPPPSPTLARCGVGAVPTRTDAPAWWARADSVDRWPAPAGFFFGDTVQITAPYQTYVSDFWGTSKSTRGDLGSVAPPGWPAPGVRRYALLARVTTGRAFVADQGWFEAGEWFRALGHSNAEQGACTLYDGGRATGALEVRFNDDSVGDNAYGASVSVRHWF